MQSPKVHGRVISSGVSGWHEGAPLCVVAYIEHSRLRPNSCEFSVLTIATQAYSTKYNEKTKNCSAWLKLLVLLELRLSNLTSSWQTTTPESFIGQGQPLS